MNYKILELVGMICVVSGSYYFANKHKKEIGELEREIGVLKKTRISIPLISKIKILITHVKY
jgi:hypothetical protein